MRKTLFLLLLFSLLLLTPFVHAIAVDCGPIYTEYGSGKQIPFTYQVFRTDSFAYELEGEFKDYYIIEREGPNFISGILVLPPGYTEPGRTRTSIRFLESVGTGGNVVAQAAIRCPIYVDYPYPGRYLLYDFSVENANEGEHASAKLKLESRGDEFIEFADLTVRIGRAGSTMQTYQERFNAIQPAQVIQRTIDLPTTELSPGYYEYTATVSFPQETLTRQGTFRMGSLDVNVLNITRTVNQSPFTAITFVLENNWNNPVNAVYVEYRIENEQIAFPLKRSSIVDLGAFERAEIRDISETPGILPGMYFIQYTIHFDGNTKSGVAPLIVVNETVDLMPILLILIAILTTIAIITFIVITRKKDRSRHSKRKRS